jgi:hypothetical protein
MILESHTASFVCAQDPPSPPFTDSDGPPSWSSGASDEWSSHIEQTLQQYNSEHEDWTESINRVRAEMATAPATTERPTKHVLSRSQTSDDAIFTPPNAPEIEGASPTCDKRSSEEGNFADSIDDFVVAPLLFMSPALLSRSRSRSSSPPIEEDAGLVAPPSSRRSSARGLSASVGITLSTHESVESPPATPRHPLINP